MGLFNTLQSSSHGTLSTPLIVLLAVVLVLATLAAALFFVKRHKGRYTYDVCIMFAFFEPPLPLLSEIMY